MLRPHQRSEFLLLLILVSAPCGHGLGRLSLGSWSHGTIATSGPVALRLWRHTLCLHRPSAVIDGEREPSLRKPDYGRGDASRRKILLLSNAVWLAALGSDGAQASVDTSDDDRPETSPAAPRQPYAPSVSNLVPATRVRLWLQNLVDLASQAATAATDAKGRSEILAQIRRLLVESPPPFLSVASPEEERAFEQYRATPTLDAWNRARQQEADATSRFQTPSAPSAPSFLSPRNPIVALNEGVEQWGERRQFRRLQREQRELEKSNAVRAAFNAYTNNLLYGDSVRLTAAPELRKQLIREDRLPDVSSVIRSDLDLRDLYRNQVLSAIDDAKAELAYQLAQGDDGASRMDATDLLASLRAAQASCDLWFSLVPDQDAKEALRVVSQIS